MFDCKGLRGFADWGMGEGKGWHCSFTTMGEWGIVIIAKCWPRQGHGVGQCGVGVWGWQERKYNNQKEMTSQLTTLFMMLFSYTISIFIVTNTLTGIIA